MKKLIAVFFVYIFCSSAVVGQSLSYKPGGGIKLSNDEEEWSFRTLGYVQSTFTYHKQKENGAIDNSFFVRRARLDFIFDYLDKYQLFIELDGRGARTELVLAQVDIEYFENHKIEIGKFITPFSPENLRSSRALSTVERYTGLNSMFLLPGLDTQYGIMFFGKFDKLGYYLSITNGNGKASDNLKENNNAKDLQLRLEYNLTNQFKFGGSFNLADEHKQELKLVDHTFESFNSAKISGQRNGYLFYAEFENNPFLLRGEAFLFDFQNSLSAEQQVSKFYGGYGEIGYFLTGNYSNGFQLIGRYETARYGDIHSSLKGATEMNSFLFGPNIYLDGIFRLQINLIYEKADSPSLIAGRFEGKDNELQLLTMLQIKF